MDREVWWVECEQPSPATQHRYFSDQDSGSFLRTYCTAWLVSIPHAAEALRCFDLVPSFAGPPPLIDDLR